MASPLEGLRPGARRIVEATRSLLVSSGYRDLSLEAIANECGLHKAVIRHYFGNKAGLMALVHASFGYDSIADVANALRELAREPTIAGLPRLKRQAAENLDVQLPLFEILPGALRGGPESAHLLWIYERLEDLYVEFFAERLPSLSHDEAKGLAQVLMALVDGLSIRYAMQPEPHRLDRAFAVFEALFSAWLTARETPNCGAPFTDGASATAADGIEGQGEGGSSR